MAQFSPSNQTVEVTTGNVRTTVDFPNPTTAGAGFNLVGFPFPYPTGIYKNPLGSTFWDNLVSTANPNGQPTKYRYLKLVLTATPTIQGAPAAVWYTDATMTAITATIAEAWGGASSFAGLMMPNSTDFVGLTTAQLKANGGAAVWVAVAGIVTGVASASAAAGDQLLATQADWTTTGGFSKVALGTAPTNRVAGYAFAATPSTVYVNAESL